MTTTDNAQTWRDLLGDLTPEQVAELEYCEREQIPPGLSTEQHRLNGARAMIRHNLAQAFCAGIEPPADAVDEPSPWIEWDDNTYQRVYGCWERRAGGVLVQILGFQYSDSRPIERNIFYEDTDKTDDMTADRARIMAALLSEAAERLDTLNGDTPPFM